VLSKYTEKSVKPEGNLRLYRWPKQPLRRDLVFVTSTTEGVSLHDRQQSTLMFSSTLTHVIALAQSSKFQLC
jgi:hypothetical protein